MLILAIDTSMAACSAAVHDTAPRSVLAAHYTPMDKGQAEAIAPMVKDVMAQAGLAFAALGRIAVTTGPGTFTGVRIGLAMARGLGLALAIPVTGIDSLSAIAANEGNTGAPLLVVADARRNEVYAGLYRGGKMLNSPAVIALDRLVIPPGAMVTGTAADAVIAGAKDCTRGRGGDLPDAAKFGMLDMEGSGGMPGPLYLREPDAKPQNAPHIRATHAGEMALLAALHAQCFDDPWTDDAFASLLSMPGAAAYLAMKAGQPAGFVVLRTAADETEIITIGTIPAARRGGIAKALIAQAAGNTKLFIEVAAGNAPARALYRQLGFVEAGVRPNYYRRPQSREDAVIMRRDGTP